MPPFQGIDPNASPLSHEDIVVGTDPTLEAFEDEPENTTIAKSPGISDEQYENPYEIDWTQTYLKADTGRRAMAVAGDPDASTRRTRSVKVHAGVTKLVVLFHKIRKGIPPDVPSPEPPSDNEVLESAEIETENVRIDEDGESYRFEVRGRYIYHLLDPEWYRNGVQFPVVPSTTVSLSDAILAVENFKAGQFQTPEATS